MFVNLLCIALVVMVAVLGKKVSTKDEIIQEYQKSLEQCENRTIKDQIIDKIKKGHEHND